MSQFEGVTYRRCDNWNGFIFADKTTPICYLEIGTFYGANILSVAGTYGYHPDSKLHCIDPWEDYTEYEDQQCTIYDTFCRNIERSGKKDKIIVHRGYSDKVIPTFDDAYFDIIYIDGNHEPEYVLEDAVLAFRKLKVGGYMVFNDNGWGGPDLTQRGIDAFMNAYHKRIEFLGARETQVFVKKLR
jgi:predicted O-methyltransferase YrrM